MRSVNASNPSRERSRPGRLLYVLPVLLLVASAWTFRSGKQTGDYLADEYSADGELLDAPGQSSPPANNTGFVTTAEVEGVSEAVDQRRFRVVDDQFVEDAGTGIRLPAIPGLTPSEVFARASQQAQIPAGFDDPAAAQPQSQQVDDASQLGTGQARSGGGRRPAFPNDLRYGIGPRPSSLTVQAIGVRSAVIPIGIDGTRAIQVPKRADVVGWWSGGSAPGEPGPTVLVGHFDSKTAAGVFARLKEVTVGDLIVASQTDGALYTYYVTEIEHLSKSAFPTERVYGRTADSTLRLVTCGGKFDRKTGHYVENTIVYAELWSSVPSPWSTSTTTLDPATTVGASGASTTSIVALEANATPTTTLTTTPARPATPPVTAPPTWLVTSSPPTAVTSTTTTLTAVPAESETTMTTPTLAQPNPSP